MRQYWWAPIVVGVGIWGGAQLWYWHGLSRAVAHCGEARHFSYFSRREFFDQAYQTSPPILTRVQGPQGVLVNHHLLAAPLMAQVFNQLATTEPVTVLLVSPNHFSAGQAPIITSAAQWETPYGVLAPDCQGINKVVAQQVAVVDEQPFEREHGISGLVAFIKHSLPNARVIPLIVRDEVTAAEIDRAADYVSRVFDDAPLVVGSFDFSHYVTNEVAMRQDAATLAAIQKFDYPALTHVAVDSRPGLRLVLKYLDLVGAKHFTLLASTNSAQLLHRLDLAEVTSYLNGIFTR